MADQTKDPQVETAATDTPETPAKAEKAPKADKAEAAPKSEKADKPAKPAKAGEAYTPRLKRDYEERIVKAMTDKFGYKNRLEVPRLDKIVINMGVGEATQDKKKVELAAAEMQAI